MSKFKKGYQQSKDKNEPDIIEVFEKYDWHVVNKHDDLLCFKVNDLYQVEVKSDCPFLRSGEFKKKGDSGALEDSQYEQLCNAGDRYVVLWTKQQAKQLADNENKSLDRPLSLVPIIITPSKFRKNYKRWLSREELNRLKQKPWWNL